MRADATILGLDIGEKRIGVARANAIALLPEPLLTLSNDGSFIDELQSLIAAHKVGILVVGLPRNLRGDHTQQTHMVEQFVKSMKTSIDTPIFFQDEALTSVAAKTMLASKRGSVSKGDIDAQAAAIILQDFITHEPQVIKEFLEATN